MKITHLTISVLIWLLAGATARGQEKVVVPDPGMGSLAIGTITTGPPSFVIGGTKGPLVTIKPDGTIIYGDGYTPETAAKVFWDAVGAERKSRNCP